MLHHHYHVTGTSPKGKINSPAMPLSIALEEAASYAKASNLPRVSSGVYGADFYSSGDAHFNGTWIIVEPCDMEIGEGSCEDSYKAELSEKSWAMFG